MLSADFWPMRRWFTVSVLAMTTLIVGCEPNPLLRRQGMDALDTGDLDWAENRFSVAIRQDVTDWKSQYYMGVIRLKQGRPLDAQLHLEQALILRDDHAETGDILDELAQALLQQQMTEKLYAVLQEAADRYGTTRDYLRQADYLAKSGDADQAKIAYRKALRFAAPDDPTPYVAMADFYESIGNTSEAITALRQAHGIAPSDRKLANRLRQYGIVPGPAAALSPDESH